jgi:dipeptidyl aminopeptidase/acylaminoacyl peptidase
MAGCSENATRKILVACCLGMLCTAVQAGKLSVDDFLADPDVYDVAISPNGRYLAEVGRHKELRVVTIYDLDAEGAPQIGQVADDILRAYAIEWANDERLLVHMHIPLNMRIVRRESDEEDFDIDDHYMTSRTIAIGRDGKDDVVLMKDAWRARRSNWSLSSVRRIADDPKHVLMPAFSKGMATLYKVNVYDGTSEPVVTGGNRTYVFIADKSGQPLYRIDTTFTGGRGIRIYKYLNGEEWQFVEKIPLDAEDESSPNLDDLVGLSIDGGLFYRKRNEKTGYYEIVKRHAKTDKEETFVSLPDRDVLGLNFDKETGNVDGYRVEEDDVIRVRYFDQARQALYDKPKNKLAKYAFNFHSRDREGRRSIINSYGPDFPGSYFIYDHKQDNLSIYAHERGRLTLDDLAVPAVVTYPARDKVKIRAYVLLPPGYKPGQPYPLVLLPHGGPHARSYALYDDLAQFIATRGYIVMMPNFRGSTGYGLEFEKAGYKQWGRLMQDDLDDAVTYMVKKGYADPARVCIAGASGYGGYAALMGLIKSPSIYKCGISINGVSHLRDQLKDRLRFNSGSEKSIAKILETMGDPDADKDYLNSYSPLPRANEIKSPLLLIAGSRDAVQFYQSKDLADALEDSKAKFTYLKVKYAADIDEQEDAAKVYKAVEEFLQKKL